MPYRIIEAPEKTREEQKSKGFKIVPKPQKKPGIATRIAAKVPAEFFGSLIGQGPQIAELAAQTTPEIEEREEQARPSYLSSTGLEAAPERGLRNLLTMLGQSDLVKKLTPQSLSERFRETTGGQFEPQTPIERVLARGAQLAGGVRGLGGAGRSSISQALAGALGQTGRELGLPEPAATAVELGTGLGGESLKKGLVPKPAEKKLVEFAKRKGLTDTEITPLLKSKNAQEKLGSLALKTGKLKKSVKQIAKKFEDNFYEPLKESADKVPKLNEKQTQEFFDSLVPVQKELTHSKLPTVDKEYAKEQLIKLAEKVAEEGLSPRDIVDTYQDLSKNIQWKKAGSKPGKIIQNALMDTFKKVSPELAEDFQLTNQLYSKYIPFKHALDPKAIDNILSLGHDGELALALAFHNPTLIKTALGHVGGKYVANQLLTNPRYHNFSKKLQAAVYKQDKIAINRLVNQFQQMLDKDLEKKKI